MRERIKAAMEDLMQNNCVCNYVFVQNGKETYVSNVQALDAYTYAHKLSKNGNVECFMAVLGPHNKAARPVFSVINGVAMLGAITI